MVKKYIYLWRIKYSFDSTDNFIQEFWSLSIAEKRSPHGCNLYQASKCLKQNVFRQSSNSLYGFSFILVRPQALWLGTSENQASSYCGGQELRNSWGAAFQNWENSRYGRYSMLLTNGESVAGSAWYRSKNNCSELKLRKAGRQEKSLITTNLTTF
jgi:hypothetical protein